MKNCPNCGAPMKNTKRFVLIATPSRNGKKLLKKTPLTGTG